MSDAPQGTVTFLFTDIVGSTRLWERFPQQMGPALARHDAIIRAAVRLHHGHVFKTVGDAFCLAFHTPADAVLAAVTVQRDLAAEPWGELGPFLVRMGMHTGTAEQRDGDYFGGTLNRTSRIEAAAHGGQILLSQVACELLADERPAGIDFKSLGSHRLRNLDRPEHLFQVCAPGLTESFPPPRSMEVLPNNLPVQTTSFVGREREMAEAEAQMEKTRLLTLMGTGGTGKTRLALELGARLINEFRDGVWLVELAPVTDPGRVLEAVAAGVGVREDPDRPLRDAVIQFLRSKNLLIILDNCEHVLAQASAVAADLLRNCPRLKILAASRHSLGIAGETTFPVPPLHIFDIRLHTLTGPDLAAQLSQFEAVKLFIERATAVRPDFVVTNANAPALAEICSRLDGIPLAIELAAARVRVLDLDQIAARLGDRFRLLRGNGRTGNLPHQQTLQALIDWSYDLLSEPERILFRRLGVFVGGRTLDAMETVCAGDGIEDFEILDLVQQLVDKSLVTVERLAGTEPRYTLIESVWQYAREKLEASGELPALRDRHLACFLALAEKAGPQLEGPDQADWLDRCQAEQFNFRAALRWAIESANPEPAFRIFTETYRATEIRGNLAEARNTVDQLLALPATDVPVRVRADFLISAGRIAWAADQYDEARARLAAAREIYQELQAGDGLAIAEMLHGFLDRGDGNTDSAEAHFTAGLEIARRVRHRFAEAGCLSGLGSVALDRGDVARARELKEQSLLHYESLGDRWIVGLILWGIVQTAIAQGDCERARSGLREWAQIARDLGNSWILPYILECQGNLAAASGNALAAAEVLGAAEAAREHFGTQFSPTELATHQASVQRLQASLAPAELAAAWETGRRLSPWDAIARL